MAPILFTPLIPVSKVNTKSPGWISMKAHGCLRFGNYSRAKRLAWRNIPSFVVGEDAKAIETYYGKPDYVQSVSTFKEAPSDEMDKRIEELVAEIKAIFNSMEDGEISPSPYDTAWVAKISAVDGSAKPQFPQMVDWILHNQLPDGSWGENRRFLACDRLLNTLSCIVTLAFWGVGNNQVNRGVEFLRRNPEGMIKEALGHHRSKGFEMVFPVLLNESKLLGLDLPYELPVMKQINKKRDSELKKVSVEELHSHPSTMLQCLEGIQEVVNWKNILKMQSKDGSFSGSPASTACIFIHTGDDKCLKFLTSLVAKFEDHVPSMYPVDIAERLRAVDSVESLGIERHFQTEIKQAMDYVFHYWSERGIGFGRESLVPDIDITATAFRLLRAFGYTVSSDALQNIKSEAEELCKQSGDENSSGIIAMLSLYRCSQLNFPGENVMREISSFAKDYLARSLESKNFCHAKAVKENLRQEIEYALSARWNRNMPRLMARNHIVLRNPDDLWLGKTLYQWYKDCKFPQLDFTRHTEVAIYWTSSAVLFEPQHTECRLAYTKAGILALITDDLYDNYATLDQAKLINQALERWDPLVIDQLPEDMKIVFMGLYNTLTDISGRAQEIQGSDVLPYLRQQWLHLFLSFTKETEWMERGYSPQLDEYRENAVVSIALGVTILTAIFCTGEILPDQILGNVDFLADFLNLVNLTGRLMNDLRTFKRERDLGKLASFLQCYINEHPGCTEEEASNYMEEVNEDALSKLNYHFLMRADIPKIFRTLLFNTARVMNVIYKNQDGLSNAAEDLEDSIKKSLYEPVL